VNTADKWTPVAKKKPTSYDLVEITDGTGRIQSGWWDGRNWDYHPKRLKGPVTHWRHKLEGYREA